MALDILFTAASIVAVAAAWLVVTRRNPVYSAAWMMAALFAVAVVFLLLHSSFAAVIQVLLYAGAILVLFLFVIMLLNPGPEEAGRDRPRGLESGLAAVLAVAFVIAIAGAIGGSHLGLVAPFSEEGAPAPPDDFGTTNYFGHTVYDQYLLPFEAISLLVMVAIAGAVLLGKRNLGEREEKPLAPPKAVDRAQRELEEMVH